MKNATLIIGGLAAAGGVAAIAIAGRTQKTSTVFAAPDAASVAAAENGVAAQIHEINSLALNRMAIAADTVVKLAEAQQVLTLGQLATTDSLEATKVVSQAEVTKTGLQSSSAEAIARSNNDAAVQSARIQSDGAVNLAQTIGGFNTQVAQIGANRDVSVAQIGGNTAVQVAETTSAAQTAQVQAQATADERIANHQGDTAKHVSNNNLIGNIVGTIAGLFTHF